MGESFVESNEGRLGDGSGFLGRKERGGEAGVGVVEINLHARDDLPHFGENANLDGAVVGGGAPSACVFLTTDSHS